VWLRIPTVSAACIAPAVRLGFTPHHAKPDYVLLTRWLPDSPSTLPAYSFTQVGVGGVVVDSRGCVLMVQERVSPTAFFQGSWKLPGGLADPGEHFGETVAREVFEETGVEAELDGLVSMRHTHGYRFGQGDLYVLVRMRARPGKDAIKVCETELADARWMERAEIEAIVAGPEATSLDGLVSKNNWRMICNALDGAVIQGDEMLPSSGSRPGARPSMLYTAPSAGYLADGANEQGSGTAQGN